jgi:excisionase family DNA binding protein
MSAQRQPSSLALLVPDELVEAIARRVVAILSTEGIAGAATTEPEAWIGPDEAARYIGKPKSRLYDLAAEGAIRHGRDGRSLLFRRADLDDYLRAHERDDRNGAAR